MACPFLDYRSETEDRQFDEPRAFCTAVDVFVQPMRADICNDRYDLDHAADCEIYREHADRGDTADRGVDDADRGGSAGGDP